MTNIIGLTAAQVNLLTVDEGINIAEELISIRESTMLEIFSEQPRRLRLTARSKTRLIALRTWIVNQKNTDPDDFVDTTDFDEQTMARMFIRYASAMTEASEKTNNNNIKMGSFNGKLEDWDDKKDEFMSFLGNQRNKQNIPLSYIVRDNTLRPNEEDMTDMDYDIYDTPLSGPVYNNDNWTVFNYLAKWTCNGSAKTHVQKFDTTHDRRSAWLSLISDYEAANTRTIKIMAARRSINDSHWTEDTTTFNFQEYCIRHLKANNTLERYEVPLDGASQVRAFLNGIRLEKYIPIKSQILANEESREDLSTAVEKFKEQLGELFKYPRKSKPKDFRQINKTDTSSKQGKTNKKQKTDHKSSTASYSNASQSNTQTSDNYDIPQEVLGQLNSFHRKMLFLGRDAMRKQGQDNYQGRGGRGGGRGGSYAGRGRSAGSLVSDITPDTTNTNNQQQSNSDSGTQGNTPTSASSLFGQRRLNQNSNNNRQQGAVESGKRRVGKTRTDRRLNHDYTGRYRFEIDSRADTTCVGRGFIPISDTGQVCNVSGFHSSMAPVEDVPIRTCATAFDHPNGTTYVLEVGQCLWFGNSMEHSLLSPNQVRSFGHFLCLTPKQYTNGESLHGIRTDGNLELPFQLHGCISYLPIRTPTEQELIECERIILTSEDIWEPYSEHFKNAERPFLNPNLHFIGATSSHDHRSSVTPETLARRWGTSVETAKYTLKNTYQRGFRMLDSDLSRRFRTRQAHMRYRHLRTNLYSDSLLLPLFA